jgi:hypothetical protein
MSVWIDSNGVSHGDSIVFDGPFYSLYPYPNKDNIITYTLTDVVYTPIFKSNNINDVINYDNFTTTFCVTQVFAIFLFLFLFL